MQIKTELEDLTWKEQLKTILSFVTVDFLPFKSHAIYAILSITKFEMPNWQSKFRMMLCSAL